MNTIVPRAPLVRSSPRLFLYNPSKVAYFCKVSQQKLSAVLQAIGQTVPAREISHGSSVARAEWGVDCAVATYRAETE